jgi:hypothetical protein
MAAGTFPCSPCALYDPWEWLGRFNTSAAILAERD